MYSPRARTIQTQASIPKKRRFIIGISTKSRLAEPAKEYSIMSWYKFGDDTISIQIATWAKCKISDVFFITND